MYELCDYYMRFRIFLTKRRNTFELRKREDIAKKNFHSSSAYPRTGFPLLSPFCRFPYILKILIIIMYTRKCKRIYFPGLVSRRHAESARQITDDSFNLCIIQLRSDSAIVFLDTSEDIFFLLLHYI